MTSTCIAPAEPGNLVADGYRYDQEQSIRRIQLHDCYAEFWLAHYDEFLRDIRKLARLRTLDEVAADMFLAGAV
jgi:hypothetical protein